MSNPANKQNENDVILVGYRLVSTPPVEEMPYDVPEENGLKASTVTFGPGGGFSVKCNLQPL